MRSVKHDEVSAYRHQLPVYCCVHGEEDDEGNDGVEEEMEPHDVDGDVGAVTPELCELNGGQESVARHLERSPVLHQQLDQALAGRDVRHRVLLQVYFLSVFSINTVRRLRTIFVEKFLAFRECNT